MHSTLSKLYHFLLISICGLLFTVNQISAKPHTRYPWMDQYKTGTYYDQGDKDSRGLHKTQFVEMQGRLGHQGMFPSRRPPISGEGFLLETTVFGDPSQVDVFLLNEKGETIAKPMKQPQRMYSNDYLFSGTFPNQPFFIAASVKFKDRPSKERMINPKRIIPRTDLTSYKFKLRFDPNSNRFNLSLPGKSLSEKEKIFINMTCQFGQMLELALNPEALNQMKEMMDSDLKKRKTIPIPSFFIRHSLGMGAEPKRECYLEVLQKQNTFDTREYLSDDPQWSAEECRSFQMILGSFETLVQTGDSYAFQESSCHDTGKDHRLIFRIGFSKNPDFKFPDEPKVARAPDTSDKATYVNRVRLKELCTVKGRLSRYQIPIDLSFEQSGRALIRTGRTDSAIFQAPDCKITANYKKADFLNNTISRDGTGLFDKDRGYGHNNKIGTFGFEKSDGSVVKLTPPDNFDQSEGDFPKISVDGSAVIWKIRYEKHKAGYLIQNLKGQTLKELRFPLGQLERAPEIYMLDMEQKRIIASLPREGLTVFNLEGKRIEETLDIPDVSLYRSRTPIKLFKGKNKHMRWVGWDDAQLDDDNKAFVTWNTDFGKGQHEFDVGQELDSVSVSGDGRYIAVAYRMRGSFMTGRQDYMFTLISTKNGQRVYTKKLGNGPSSGMITHEVAFLKNDYVAFNRLSSKKYGLHSEAAVLFEIQEKE